MNNDNLGKYLKNEQVYSNDLNVILARTPSRIFYFMLWAILAIVIIMSLCFYFITYEEKVSVQGFTKRQGDTFVVKFITDREGTEKVKLRKGLILAVDNAAPGTAELPEINTDATDVVIRQVYLEGGKEIDVLPDSSLLKQEMPVSRYRVELTLRSPELAKHITDEQNHLTNLTIRLARKKLYKKFI